MTSSSQFPPLDPDLLAERLAPPTSVSRVVIDTDAANEIDDQFAIVWAWLSPEHMTVEAVTAEPYSFAHHRKGLLAAALGCVTNIAAAILRAPEIRENIVVVWTSSYPSSTPHCNKPSLNLVQDVHASRLMFDSGVPLVYLPGYHVVLS